MKTYFKLIANYSELNDDHFFTLKSMFCVDELLNLLDNSLIGLPEEAINNYRKLYRLSLLETNATEKLDVLNAEIVRLMKKRSEMTEAEKYASDAFNCSFYLPDNEHRARHQKLELTVNLLLKAGVAEAALQEVIFGFFRDIITNWKYVKIDEEDHE